MIKKTLSLSLNLGYSACTKNQFYPFLTGRKDRISISGRQHSHSSCTVSTLKVGYTGSGRPLFDDPYCFYHVLLSRGSVISRK